MSRIKRARPSPAILIAVAALVAALGGSAVAEVATTSLSKGETKKVKKLAKKQAKKFDKKQDKKNFPVDSSQIGDGAVTEAKIAGGLPPKAWANVTPSGSVKAGKGISSGDITKSETETGIYCFDGIGGATAQATGAWGLDFTLAMAFDAAALAEATETFASIGCPSSTTWAIVTASIDAGTLGDEEDSHFTVAFFD